MSLLQYASRSTLMSLFALMHIAMPCLNCGFDANHVGYADYTGLARL